MTSNPAFLGSSPPPPPDAITSTVPGLPGSVAEPAHLPVCAADDPEFFRRPPPPGRSRESTIVLRREGKFAHDTEEIAHPRLAEAMHTWIDRHPDDGRYILNNGYDWTYFTVEDSPYFVRAVTDDGEGYPLLVLSDGAIEPLGEHIRVGALDTLYTEVKVSAPRGPFEAKFSRHAQAQLGPYLLGEGECVSLRTRGGVVPLPL